jgi:hypothetical protein
VNLRVFARLSEIARELPHLRGTSDLPHRPALRLRVVASPFGISSRFRRAKQINFRPAGNRGADRLQPRRDRAAAGARQLVEPRNFIFGSVRVKPWRLCGRYKIRYAAARDSGARQVYDRALNLIRDTSRRRPPGWGGGDR